MKRTKKINQARIMREIWVNRKTTRINISRALSLDKSTVSSVVNELIDRGMILEKEEGNSGPHGGRRPIHITLNKLYGCVLGIEFRPEFYSAVLLDMEGNIIFSKTKEISFRRNDITTVLNGSISDLIEEINRSYPQLLESVSVYPVS